MNLHTLIPIVLKASVLLNIFALGLRANIRDAGFLFRRPGELFRALLAMNVLMPLVALVLVIKMDLDPAVKIALVALSVSPIPPLLPKKLVKSGGSAEYATGLLIAVGLLAIIFVPLAMELIERVLDVPLQMTAASIATLILMTVLLPIGLGVAMRTVAPAVAGRLVKPISVIAGIVLLACVVAIVWVAFPIILTVAKSANVIAIAAFVLAGLVMGYLLGGPGEENRASLAIATSSRHPGIAIAIAQANFPGQKLALAAVLLYLLINAIVSIPFQWWTKRRARGPAA